VIADYIDRCPSCGEHALRVYHSQSIEGDFVNPVLVTTFHCECRSCTWEWTAPYADIDIPTPTREVSRG
jgi:DNA-directed RNA polymerase subunit M/transcription elongation factor TFIIS